ncbi:MAG TPA: CidA/LrgA family protein, partial [Enterococcus sp.]|nr:CidA/LrgA family protein [Enterococcus sp.]
CSIVTMVAAGKTAEGVEALLGYVRKKKASRVSVNEMEENQID